MKPGLDELLNVANVAVGKKQRRPIFKYKRAGEVLTREQVKAIKAGRKILRKQLKKEGLKKKSDFELTATSMGLYFDKKGLLGILPWFFHGRGLLALAGLAAALAAMMYLFSYISTLRGHFTINMSSEMFKEGFVLSETEDFANPTTQLFCEPAENVPCISINSIPEDIDFYEGQHNGEYFAYTFWVRNEGESTVGYTWDLNLISESLNLSEAVWVMVFEDGEMAFYAEPSADGGAEALPAFDDNSRGYLKRPFYEVCKDPDNQYELITQRGQVSYYRMVPIPFVSESVVAQGFQSQVAPQDVHKYTVVIWLEGDDPECTDDKIGGHAGMEVYFQLIDEMGE